MAVSKREVGPLGTPIDRLHAQGYVDVDEQTLAEVEPWLRWSPAICAVIMGVGTLLGSAWILWGLAAVAALGTVLPRHPFDYVYNAVVRRVTGTPPLPPTAAPRRFACGMAAVWLVVTGVAFAAGLSVLGYVLGGVLTIVAALVGTTHFCLPSLIYGLVFGRPQCSWAHR